MRPYSLPPLYPASDDDRAAWVVVISVSFFIYTILALGAKLFIRGQLLGLQSYDHVLIVGTVILFIQTALVIIACKSGLGHHTSTLSPTLRERFNKVSKIYLHTTLTGRYVA